MRRAIDELVEEGYLEKDRGRERLLPRNARLFRSCPSARMRPWAFPADTGRIAGGCTTSSSAKRNTRRTGMSRKCSISKRGTRCSF
ncbi:MAG: hypothetical protein ACLUMK_05150 [Christensenellales bacterium]